jgi:hypothetical protein
LRLHVQHHAFDSTSAAGKSAPVIQMEQSHRFMSGSEYLHVTIMGVSI